jgi:hypothetical protein
MAFPKSQRINAKLGGGEHEAVETEALSQSMVVEILEPVRRTIASAGRCASLAEVERGMLRIT